MDQMEWKGANDDPLATIPDVKVYISGFIGMESSQQFSRLVSDAPKKNGK